MYIRLFPSTLSEKTTNKVSIDDTTYDFSRRGETWKKLKGGTTRAANAPPSMESIKPCMSACPQTNRPQKATSVSFVILKDTWMVEPAKLARRGYAGADQGRMRGWRISAHHGAHPPRLGACTPCRTSTQRVQFNWDPPGADRHTHTTHTHTRNRQRQVRARCGDTVQCTCP